MFILIFSTRNIFKLHEISQWLLLISFSNICLLYIVLYAYIYIHNIVKTYISEFKKSDDDEDIEETIFFNICSIKQQYIVMCYLFVIGKNK